MRFLLTSYDHTACDSINQDIGEGKFCVLPSYGSFIESDWKKTHHSWGCRYNQSLMIEAAKWIIDCGHEVTGESIAPKSRDENLVSIFESDEITTIGVYNDDVVSIRELDSNKFCIIDMQDYPSFGRKWSGSNNCIAVYMTMYEKGWVQKNTAAPEKYKPFLYFSMHPDDTEGFTQQYLPSLPVDTATDLRLFFAGTIGDTDNYLYSVEDKNGVRRPWREVALYLKKLAPDEVVIWGRGEKLSRDEWWKAAIKHRWNLFLAGGPWCNREHELWTLGCATLGIEYPHHPLMEPIIPNVHYAAVTVTDGTDHMGRPNNPETAAKQILQRYREVRDDHIFAKQLATNARERMTTVATPSHAVKRILDECWGIRRY